MGLHDRVNLLWMQEQDDRESLCEWAVVPAAEKVGVWGNRVSGRAYYYQNPAAVAAQPQEEAMSANNTSIRPLGYFASETPVWTANYKRNREFCNRFDAWKAASAKIMSADADNMRRAAKAASAMLADLRYIYDATIEEMVVARASAVAPAEKPWLS